MPWAWLTSARGVDVRRFATLVLMVLAPIVCSRIAIELRTPEDRDVYGDVLANGVLVGLVLPVSCLGGFLADRCCWLQPGSFRRLALLRAGWFAGLSLGSLVLGIAMSWALAGRAPARLLVADTLFLWGLCALSAILLGGRHAWALPAMAALVFSVPGLVPLSANLLSLAPRAGLVLSLAIGLIAAAGASFTMLDEWRLNGGLTRSLAIGDEAE